MGVALFASRFESRLYSTHETKQQSRQERVATLFHVNQLCQLSSYKACGETPSGVHTSVLPYAVLTRNQSDEIFAEFANPTKITENETNTDTIKAKKSDAVVEHENKIEESIPYDKSTHLQHYDIVFCSKADSQHVSNLESSPHPFVGPAADIPNNQTALISLTVGHARSEINQRFSSASRFPPRAVLVAKTEMVPHGSKAASLLWTNYFRQHPNVSNKLRRDDVRFYRISSIRSAQFIDLSGKLAGVESLPQFLETKPDPHHKLNTTVVNRLNTSPVVLDSLLDKMFGMRLAEKFAFDIDRYGVRVLGKETKNDDWAEYYLDFGQEIKNEGELQDFFFKFQ